MILLGWNLAEADITNPLLINTQNKGGQYEI
jgi:hypothetical protein